MYDCIEKLQHVSIFPSSVSLTYCCELIDYVVLSSTFLHNFFLNKNIGRWTKEWGSYDIGKTIFFKKLSVIQQLNAVNLSDIVLYLLHAFANYSQALSTFYQERWPFSSAVSSLHFASLLMFCWQQGCGIQPPSLAIGR